MNQKLSDWSSIAEIISGVAVVVTLIFLILGIKENTEITRASMYADHLSSFDQLGSDVYRDPELTRIYEAWLQSDISGLDALDLQRLEQIRVNMFRTYERAYLAERDGLYGPDEAERMRRLTCINYGRAVSTETTGFLDVLMTRGFREYVRSMCPEVMLHEFDRIFQNMVVSGTEPERGLALQQRITKFAQAHPDFYRAWQQQRASLSDSFDGFLANILELPIEE